MASKLDLNRGVMTKFHGSGMKVCMYIDEPGIYYSENGEELPDRRFAIEAGYDVEKDLRQKLRNERLAKFQADLDAEMRSEEDALAAAMSKSSNVDVRHIGAGQYAVFDKQGKRLTRVAMSKADVELLVGPVQSDPNDPKADDLAPGSAADFMRQAARADQ